jgi:predicted nucleic acid-binding protein
VISVVRKKTLGGKLSQARAAEIIGSLTTLVVEQVEIGMLVERIWELRENLTTYDAAYVAAAERMSCRLVTSDARMAKAPGIRCEVVVVGG